MLRTYDVQRVRHDFRAMKLLTRVNRSLKAAVITARINLHFATDRCALYRSSPALGRPLSIRLPKADWQITREHCTVPVIWLWLWRTSDPSLHGHWVVQAGGKTRSRRI